MIWFGGWTVGDKDKTLSIRFAVMQFQGTLCENSGGEERHAQQHQHHQKIAVLFVSHTLHPGRQGAACRPLGHRVLVIHGVQTKHKPSLNQTSTRPAWQSDDETDDDLYVLCVFAFFAYCVHNSLYTAIHTVFPKGRTVSQGCAHCCDCRSNSVVRQ